MEPILISQNNNTAFELLTEFGVKYEVGIPLHLRVLMTLANRDDVESVAECGVFQGWSTAAFMCCDIKRLWSYDLDLKLVAPLINQFMKIKGDINWTLFQLNSITDIIAPVDLLFLDTQHTYEHVINEINLQSHQAKKFIAVHDANYPPDNTEKKVRDAVLEFSREFQGVWNVFFDTKVDTGLIILRNTITT